MRLTQPITRRFLLAGASVAATCFGWPGHSWAETASDGFRVIRVRPLGPGSARQSPTFVSSYDGTVPGPTLRITRGKDLCVRVVNDLAEPTSVHWHGVRLPNAMDGVPGLTQAPIAP
jgi:FtsP/CotA-like multicopper oxidase with cupredoxin domain